jgi:hypothetical protein
MTPRPAVLASIFAILVALAPVGAATVSKQQADVFAKKVALITQQGEASRPSQPRRIAITESEVNSWFAFSAPPLLPQGVTDPQITIVGEGKVGAQAVVDLGAISKKRSTGGLLDPWSFLGGKVPVSVLGTLHTQDGRGQFEMESAEVSGVPLPKSLLQELVSYYSRSTDNPDGVRLDEQFELPANIRQIEVGQGQAIVVQ